MPGGEPAHALAGVPAGDGAISAAGSAAPGPEETAGEEGGHQKGAAAADAAVAAGSREPVDERAPDRAGGACLDACVPPMHQPDRPAVAAMARGPDMTDRIPGFSTL